MVWTDEPRLRSMLRGLSGPRVGRPSPQITARSEEGPDPVGVAVLVDRTGYVEQLEQQVDDLRRQLAKSYEIRTSFATDIEEQHRRHEEVVNNLTKLNTKLQKENADLSDQNQALQTRVAELLKKLDDIQREYAEQAKTIEDLRKSRNAQDRTIRDLQQRLDDMDARNLLADWVSKFYEEVVTIVNQATTNNFADYAALRRREQQLKKSRDDSLTRAKEMAAIELGLTKEQWQAITNFKGDRNRLIHIGDDEFDAEEANAAVSKLRLQETSREALLAVIRIVTNL